MNHVASNNKVACKAMCFYCFDVLKTMLEHRDNSIQPPAFPNDSYPLFVTWGIGPDSHLRGCIGTFSPEKLHDGLRRYALIAAEDDTRFQPISLAELPSLSCSVSLLLQFEDGADWQDWEVGVHGIRISFKDDKGSNMGATFLPEVAAEQGWTKKETIQHLVKKAGYKKSITDSVRDRIKLVRYQSEKVKVTYDEFAAAYKL